MKYDGYLVVITEQEQERNYRKTIKRRVYKTFLDAMYSCADIAADYYRNKEITWTPGYNTQDSIFCTVGKNNKIRASIELYPIEYMATN